MFFFIFHHKGIHLTADARCVGRRDIPFHLIYGKLYLCVGLKNTMRGSSRVLHFLLAVNCVHVTIVEIVILDCLSFLHEFCFLRFMLAPFFFCFVIYCFRDADYGMFAHHLNSQYNRNYNSECVELYCDIS